MDQLDVLEIRKILLNEWDPIGVGPWEMALRRQTINEYDDLIATIARVSNADGRRILESLNDYVAALGLPIDSGLNDRIAKRIKDTLSAH